MGHVSKPNRKKRSTSPSSNGSTRADCQTGPPHHGEGHPGNNHHWFREYLPEILLRAIPVNEEDEQ